MGRLFGIVLMVLAIWVGLEIYEHGVDGAFGGLLRSGESAEPSTREWAADAVGNAYESSEQRVLRQLDPESEPD